MPNYRYDAWITGVHELPDECPWTRSRLADGAVVVYDKRVESWIALTRGEFDRDYEFV